MLEEKEAYVLLLEDTLKQKKKVMAFLLEKTEKQQELLKQPKLDASEFEIILAQKGEQINVLNEMDEGFDSIFRRVDGEIQGNREKYREQIIHMQQLIKEITDMSMKIQTLERKNSDAFKVYLAKEKNQIREVNVSSKMASAYYQNMNNQHHSEDSYFFNQKK